jgi:lipopolysaccharide/colanic/teichoic acid biosynthesis glycosyltransferase
LEVKVLVSGGEIGTKWGQEIRAKLGSFERVLLLSGALVFAFLTWRFQPLWIKVGLPLAPVGAAVLGFGLHLTLSLLIAVWARPLPLPRPWPFRLALALSLALALLRPCFAPEHVVITVSSGLGAVLGGLALTWLSYGLWEDNYPPSPQIQAQVFQKHQRIIGRPSPVGFGKRAFDVILASAGLLASAPLWTLLSFGIWLEDPGPILFIKNSVGLGGENFRQFKFRTMVYGAEAHTGPILARQDDERTTKLGAFLRKTALDELPQLINVLAGEMSFVGPRPQRTVLVHEYLSYMPEFAERHRVLPGLSGLAQVMGSYYISPRQKLRFDNLYTRHASLGFDLKLLLLAFLIVFWLRWKPGWDGRIPRAWLRFGARR